MLNYRVLLQRVENSVAKYVDTFNANRSRQSLHAQIAGYNLCYTQLFLYIECDENPLWEFGGFADGVFLYFNEWFGWK